MRRPYSSNRSCSPPRRKGAGKKTNNDTVKIQSCFSYQSLASIARHYNDANPRDKIPIHRTRDDLWMAIRERMADCSDERCWLRVVPASERKQLVEDFKPPLPMGKYTWLNTDDIDRVLKQYERVFPEFAYLGAHPIDFQKLYRKFNPLNITALQKEGKHKAAMVLNLDYSYQPGSHWVAMFLDIDNRMLEYYDSYGEKAPKEVRMFYEQLNSSSRSGWTFKENTKVHQRKNSECGVYSIHFIVRRLSGTPFKTAVNDIIRDEEMNHNRQKYFDPYYEYDNR